MIRSWMSAAVVALVLLGSQPRADDFDEAPRPAAVRAPERGAYPARAGIYFHLEVGLSGLRSKAGDAGPGDEVELSGGGLGFSASIGGALGRYLALGGEVWEASAFQPDVKSGGSTGSTDSDSSLSLVGIGPRLTLYLAPSTADLQASIAFPCFTRMTARLNGVEGSTDAGLGGRLSLGKEWRVGASGWSMGLVGYWVFSSNKDRGDGAPTWRSNGGGLSFSTTWQ